MVSWPWRSSFIAKIMFKLFVLSVSLVWNGILFDLVIEITQMKKMSKTYL